MIIYLQGVENIETDTFGEYLWQLDSADIIEIKCTDRLRQGQPRFENGYFGNDDVYKTGWCVDITYYIMEVLTTDGKKEIYFNDGYARSQAINDIADRMQNRNINDKNNDFYLKKKKLSDLDI